MLRKLTVSLLCFWLFCSCREEKSEWETIHLLKQLNSADLIFDTNVVDIGKPAFRSYLLDGWSIDRTEKDGTTSAVGLRKRAQATFYCHTPQDKLLVVRCKLEPGFAEAQSLDVVINSQKIPGGVIQSEYKEYRIPVSARWFVPGRNHIRFVPAVNTKKSSNLTPGIAFDYFAFVKKESPAMQPEISLATARPSEFYFTEVRNSKGKKVLAGPLESAIAFYEKIPPNAQLQVGYGLFPEENVGRTSAEFLGFIEREDGRKEQLFRETIARGHFVSPEESQKIPLQKYSNEIVRIVVASNGVSGKPAASRIYWTGVTLLSPKTSKAQEKTAVQTSSTRPNVFIYLIDALRADHLQSYGYSKSTSPRIKQFSTESVVFENAYAQSAWTRASIATIMTGLYPSSHLTEGRKDTLPDFIPTIASELKKNGYANHAFVTNSNVGKLFRFHRGYDSYNQMLENGKSKEIHVQSDALFESLSDLLNQQVPTPLYLYAHATDPHEPYTPAPFSLDIPADCHTNEIKIIRPYFDKNRTYDRKEIECMIALYDSEILKSDHYFGQFIDLLKQKNLYKNSVIILTADHGEEFMEHDIFKHGESLYQSEIQIPLIIHFPDNTSAGRRIKSYARHMDILPTILESTSTKIPPGVQGTSLLRSLQGSTFQGPVFGELSLDNRISKYLILYQYKLLANRKGSAFVNNLFDIVADPLEKEDLSKKYPVRFAYMRKLMNEWMEAQQKRKALLTKPPEAVLDKESEEALKALGYIQ